VTAPARTWNQLRKYAFALPEAYEDHPWGESVAKVRKKVFVFFGSGDSELPQGMSVKLRESHPLVLAQPGASPTGYGLGAAGWVTIRISADMPFAMLREWIDESYRAVAPRKLVAQLDKGIARAR
jgi:predicted DNA-binding protein (MmcQ/YjbR family)